jgi:hypothetical protein
VLHLELGRTRWLLLTAPVWAHTAEAKPANHKSMQSCQLHAVCKSLNHWPRYQLIQLGLIEVHASCAKYHARKAQYAVVPWNERAMKNASQMLIHFSFLQKCWLDLMGPSNFGVWSSFPCLWKRN